MPQYRIRTRDDVTGRTIEHVVASRCLREATGVAKVRHADAVENQGVAYVCSTSRIRRPA